MAFTAHQLLAFSDALNERWFPKLRGAPLDLLDANLEFSFRSPLGILTHIANIEMAWMDVVEGTEPKWARTSTKEHHTLEPVLAYLGQARARTHALVDDLSDKELARPCAVKPGLFAKDAFTVDELLFTVFTHEQWHRGEVIAAFWSRDLEPPPLDYPRYGTF